MFSLWKFSHCHRYTLPIHIWESRTQCSTRFDMENVSSSSTFPGNLLSHWAEATLAKTIGRVWWSWQSRWGVIRTVLTHYFKQTERAPMRGFVERDGIWQGSPGCSPKEATIFCRRNLLTTLRQAPNKTYANTLYLRYRCTFSQNMLHKLESLSKPMPGAPATLWSRWTDPLAQETHQTGTETIPGAPTFSSATELVPTSHINSGSGRAQMWPPEIQMS